MSQHIKIFVTSTCKFRAKVRPLDSKPFEVTVGGKSWTEGRGAEFHSRILQKCDKMLEALRDQVYEAKEPMWIKSIGGKR